MNHLTLRNEDGTMTLVFVLEPGNILKLTQGHPIEKHLADYFPDGVVPQRCDLVIMFSETPIADAKEFTKMAAITIDERAAREIRPHCPECRSTIEQLGVWRNESPMAICFCTQCGSVFGMVPQEVANALPRGKEET
jgi:hypothetical protein